MVARHPHETHKLKSLQQQRMVVRLWAEGFLYPEICRQVKKLYDVDLTPEAICYYARSDSWADERRKAIEKADKALDNIPPIARRKVRQARREKLYAETHDEEQKRKLLADAAKEDPPHRNEAPAQTTVNILQITQAALDALDGHELAAVRAKLERALTITGSAGGVAEDGEDSTGA